MGLLVFSVGCSTTSVITKDHQQIIPQSLRIRRPPAAGASAEAGPGGEDYKSNPVPNERYDCETADSLFSNVNFEAIRACLLGQVDSGQVNYRLKRVPVPYLTLDEVKTAPACLVQHLKEIPVPREIFYQAVEEEKLQCFSSRLNIEADEMLGEKMPFDVYHLSLKFPLSEIPNDDPAMLRMLISWSLTPFWELDGRRKLPSRYVPQRMCKACFGEKNLLKDDEAREPWPPPK